jgi:hypothetical protein
LHSKQNAEINALNREQSDSAGQARDVNPFAADEDDDSDDGEANFSIGDVEAEDEGKGKSHAGPSLAEGQESLLGSEADKNVGIPSGRSLVAFSPPVASVSGKGRSGIPSLWQFSSSPKTKYKEGWDAVVEDIDTSHFRGWSANDEQSSDEDSDGEYGAAAFGDGTRRSGKRRLSSTTEAKRRTSLEDDDEDEVVHVGMAEVREKGVEEKGEGDDEELVEIQHTEMPGVGEVQL